MKMLLGALLLLMAAVAAMMTDNASLMLMAMIAALILYWLLRDYRILIMAYSILPTLAISLNMGFVTPFIAVTPLVVLASLIHYQGKLSELRGPALYFVPLLLQVVFVVIAELATDAAMSFANIFSLLGGMVMALLVNAFLRKPEDQLLVGLTIVVNLLILGGSAMLGTDWTAMNVEQVRVAGLAGEPNLLGMHMGRMIPVAVALLLERGIAPWQRALAAGATVLGFLSVLVSASRTGTIAVVVGLIALAVLSARSVKHVLFSALLFTGIVLVSMYLTPASFQTRVLEPAGLARGEVLDVNRVEVSSGRLGQLPIAISMVEKSPWVGNGTGGFMAENASRHAGTATALHNAYLSVFVAYGIPAGLTFIFALSASIWLGVRHVRRSPMPLVSAAITAGAIATVVGLSAYPESFRSWVWLPILLPHAFARVNRAWFKEQQLASAANAQPEPPQESWIKPIGPVRQLPRRLRQTVGRAAASQATT